MNNNNTDKITISVNNRTGKKYQTFVYGFAYDLDLPKILKYFKKKFSCTGSIENSEEFGEVIKLTGNHKKIILNFLIKEEICKMEDIIIKGI
jgi:translation initiation factor 1